MFLSWQEVFEEYAVKAKTLPENTTNESKLILYGLYKQATVGPVDTSMCYTTSFYQKSICSLKIEFLF